MLFLSLYLLICVFLVLFVHGASFDTLSVHIYYFLLFRLTDYNYIHKKRAILLSRYVILLFDTRRFALHVTPSF